MKQRIIGTLLIVLLLAGKGYSQLDNFDLSKYKLPNLERKSLNTSFGFSGNNSYSEYPSNINRSYSKAVSNYYHGNFQVMYNSYLNNVSYQRQSNMGLDFSPYFDNSKQDNRLVQRRFNISPDLYINSQNRKYFNSDKFFEYDLNLSYGFSNSNVSINNYYTQPDTIIKHKDDLKTNTFQGSLPIKIGIGRIEQVQDARQAVYLFKELAKQGRVSPDKSDKDIIQFAKLISQLRTKRFYDSRIQKIYQLEAIDSFLLANNYVLDHDIRYFTTLSDFWDYGNGPLRSSGTSLSAALYPGYIHYGYKDTGDSYYYSPGDYRYNAITLNGGLEFVRDKPINLFWQNSLNANVLVGVADGKFHDKLNSVNNDIMIPDLQLGFSQGIGFYPNTRTSIIYSYGIQYIRLFDKSDSAKNVIGAGGKAVEVSSDLSINYYISQKLRLSLSSHLLYIWQDLKNQSIANFDNLLGNDQILNDYYSVTGNDSMKKNFTDIFSVNLAYSIF